LKSPIKWENLDFVFLNQNYRLEAFSAQRLKAENNQKEGVDFLLKHFQIFLLIMPFCNFQHLAKANGL
jgi:hypothetical protein